jgi:hypothetical protein
MFKKFRNNRVVNIILTILGALLVLSCFVLALASVFLLVVAVLTIYSSPWYLLVFIGYFIIWSVSLGRYGRHIIRKLGNKE